MSAFQKRFYPIIGSGCFGTESFTFKESIEGGSNPFRRSDWNALSTRPACLLSRLHVLAFRRQVQETFFPKNVFTVTGESSDVNFGNGQQAIGSSC